MRILSYDMPKDWNYFLFGDDHIGAALRFDKGFRKLIYTMKHKYKGVPAKHNYGCHSGDIVEAIEVNDPRYRFWDHGNRKSCVVAQMRQAVKEYWPIRKQMLVIDDGNHPAKLWNHAAVTHEICKSLGVSYGTYTAKLIFKHNGELQFKHLSTHGSGSISSIADDPERRKLNWRLALKRKLRDLVGAGDCFLESMGHTHKVIVSKPTETLYMTDNDGKIEQHYTGEDGVPQAEDGYIHPDYRWYVNTGSFLKVCGDTVVEDDDVPIEDSKLGSGYAEQAMYPAIQLGYCVGLIRDNVLRDVVVEKLG